MARRNARKVPGRRTRRPKLNVPGFLKDVAGEGDQPSSARDEPASTRHESESVGNQSEGGENIIEQLAGDGADAAEETGHHRRSAELEPELAALLAEAQASPLASDQPAESGAAAPAAAGADRPIVQPEAFTQFASTAVMAVGNYACDMFHVTRLEQNEAGALAVALCDLAQAYDMLGQLDPRTAAWLSVAAISAAIIGNRRKVEPEPAPANDAGNPAAQAA